MEHEDLHSRLANDQPSLTAACGHNHALQRLNALCRALILFGLGGYLAFTIGMGNLGHYINIHYAWFTEMSMSAFFLLGFVALVETFRARDGVCDCRAAASGWKLAILLVPVLYGFAIAPQLQGTSGFFEDSSINMQQALIEHVGTSNIITTENIPNPAVLYSLANDIFPDTLYSTDNQQEYTIIDWLRFYTRTIDENAMDGKPVDLVGFVIHQKNQDVGQFTVSRFFMRHCIFDTIPIGLYVEWRGAEGLKDGTWVRVRGSFSMRSGVPVIVATSVDITEQPNPPYLYPENPAQ